jgi:hypothetical protein
LARLETLVVTQVQVCMFSLKRRPGGTGPPGTRPKILGEVRVFAGGEK